MEFIPTGFDGLTEIVPEKYIDDRGYFFEAFHVDKFRNEGIKMDVKQINQSFSQQSVLRGLHLQREPYGQAKLVRVLSGKVLDVVVDIRSGSNTFGKHFKCILDSERLNMLYVPVGFAHGFVTLEDSVFQYECSAVYDRASETGIRWNDPELGIDWGIEDPIISEKDLHLPTFREYLDQ